MNLLDRKFLHSVISPIGDIKIALMIEGQTNWPIKLIWFFPFTISTYNDSALLRSFRPTHHTIIPKVCHIDSIQRIDEQSLRKRQLCQSTSYTLTTSDDNSFFCTFIPFHHTMIAI